MLLLTTMLFLKTLSCMVICFGLVQTKCIQNTLLDKVLRSKLSNGEKLEKVNKLVLNGHLYGQDLDEILAPLLNPSLVQSTAQLPTIPASAMWDPWTSLGRSQNKIYQQQMPPPMWSPLGISSLRQEPSVPYRFPIPSWNPFVLEGSQPMFYPNDPYQYQPPHYIYKPKLNLKNSPSLLNLPNTIYNNGRYESNDARHAGMESPMSSQNLEDMISPGRTPSIDGV